LFPATGTWPPGIAAAEAIRAGDSGGKRAALLGVGLAVGVTGSWLKIPMSAFGVAFIGNVWALTMFGIGLLVRGYATPVAGIDIAKMYVPHGFMVGAGVVALVQVGLLIARRGTGDAIARAADDTQIKRATGRKRGLCCDRGPDRPARWARRPIVTGDAGRLCRLRRLCRLCA
jgi:uncharacterized oligopeptide transporter (OPT) family protein